MARKISWLKLLIIFLVCLVSTSVATNKVSADTVIHDVNAKWIASGDKQTVEEIEGVSLLTTDGVTTVKLQLGFSTSGNDPIPPGNLTIKIPKEVFKMHEGKESTKEYPFGSNSDYAVEYHDDGYIHITNKIQLGAATQQTMDIVYKVNTPADVWSNVPGEPFKITVELPGQPPKESKTLQTKMIASSEVTNVSKELKTLYTNWQPNWDENYKPENDGDYWYAIWEISTTVKKADKTSTANQAIKLWMEENDHDGNIIGYATYDGSTPKYDELTREPDILGDLDHETDGYAYPNYKEWGIVVAYPKDNFVNENEVTINNKATIHWQNDSDEPKETEVEGSYTFKNISWFDGMPGGYGFNAQKHGRKFVYGGVDILDNGHDVYSLDYRVSAHAYNAETRQINDDQSATFFGDEFTMQFNDDILCFPLADGPLQLESGDYEVSGFDAKWIAYTVKENFTKGKWELVNVDYSVLEAVGRNPIMYVYGYKNGAWQESPLASFQKDAEGTTQLLTYDESVCVPDGIYGRRDHISLIEGSGYTRLKWVITLNKGVMEKGTPGVDGFNPAEYIYYIDIGNHSSEGQFYRERFDDFSAVADSYGQMINIRLFANSEKVKRAIAEFKNGEKDVPMYVDNIITFLYKDKDKNDYGTAAQSTAVVDDDYYRGLVFGWDEETYAQGKPEALTLSEINTEDGNYLIHRIGRNFLTEIESGSSMSKSVSTYTGGDTNYYNGIVNDPDNKRVKIGWYIHVNSWIKSEGTSLDELRQLGLYNPLDNGVVYELLPLGMTVEDSTIMVKVNGESSIEKTKLVRDQDFTVEHIPNWNDSGRELLIIRVNVDNAYANYDSRNGKTYTDIDIFMRTFYGWDSIYDYGDTFENLGAFETNYDSIPDGEYSIPTSQEFTDEEKTWLKGLDPSYTEIEGTTPGKFIYTKSKPVTINVLTQARYGLTKTIKGPESPDWGTGRVGEVIGGKPNQIEISTGGLYQYRLRYAATEGTKISDMILYDALEVYDPDLYTPEHIAERPNTSGTPSDKEDQGTVRFKGTLLSIDVTQPKNVIGVAPKVYVNTDPNFRVGELEAEDNNGRVPTYHENEELDVSKGSWVEIPVNTKTNVATVPENLLGKATGIAIDMRKGKDNADFVLDNRKSVAVILNMQGPTDPLEVRDLVVRANMKESPTATRPYTYNGVSMNAVLTTQSGISDPGSVITNYYTRLTLKIPTAQINVSKKLEGSNDRKTGFNFTCYVTGYRLEDATNEAGEHYQKLVKDENAKMNYIGRYYILDIVSGYLVDKNGGFVTRDGYKVVDDEVTSEKALEEDYTYETKDGTFSIKNGQRAELFDAFGDLPYVVEENNVPGDMDTYHEINGTVYTSTVTDPFVVGNNQIARINYTNITSSTIKVIKQWDDNDNEEGKRPEELLVTLYADGKEIDSVILKEGNWEHTFTDLIKHNEDGKEIVYTVEEEVIKYYMGIKETNGNITTLTNVYKPWFPEKFDGTGNFIVRKTVSGNARSDKEYTFNITFTYEGEETYSTTVKIKANNQIQFDTVPAGTIIKVVEKDTGYKTTYEVEGNKNQEFKVQKDVTTTMIVNNHIEPNKPKYTHPKTGIGE